MKSKEKILKIIIAIIILAFSEAFFSIMIGSTGYLQWVLHYFMDMMICSFTREPHKAPFFLTIIYGGFAAVSIAGIIYAMLYLIPRFILVSFDVIKEKNTIETGHDEDVFANRIIDILDKLN